MDWTALTVRCNRTEKAAEVTETPGDLERFFRPAIRQMQAYQPGEQPQGGKFIKLNTNENPYPPSVKVLQAIREAAESGLQRYPDRLVPPSACRPRKYWGRSRVDSVRQRQRRHLDDRHPRFRGRRSALRLPYPSYILYRTLAQLQAATWEEIRFQPDFSLAEEFSAGGRFETGLSANEQPQRHPAQSRVDRGGGPAVALPTVD